MLKKCNRIVGKTEFEIIKKEGRVYHSPFFGYLILKKSEGGKQFGIVVSKRISKKAVVRNKIRRLVFEAFRKNIDVFPDNTSILILTKPRVVGEKMDGVEREIVKIAGVI